MPKTTAYLTPAPGLRVVNPATKAPLPAEGETVELDTYWIRRIGDQDVTEGKAPAAAAAASSVKPAYKKD